MPAKFILIGLLMLRLPVCFAAPAADLPKQHFKALSSPDIAGWGLGLVVVLGVFFLCVWSVRKLGGLTVGGAAKMRIIGGLSLGMREKIILLQAGKKQLILGVTPGRIETLHVLEGDDCLLTAETDVVPAASGFAQKLAQAMKVRTEHNPSGQP